MRCLALEPKTGRIVGWGRDVKSAIEDAKSHGFSINESSVWDVSTEAYDRSKGFPGVLYYEAGSDGEALITEEVIWNG